MTKFNNLANSYNSKIFNAENLVDVYIDIDKIERAILNEVWVSVGKNSVKSLEDVITREIFEQIFNFLHFQKNP